MGKLFSNFFNRIFSSSIPVPKDKKHSFDGIDAILYINLAHREDRKEHIENELTKISPLCQNIQRIDAVKHQNGAKGCAASHIKALKYAKASNFKNTLIVEDDLLFRAENITEILHNILKILEGNYDVLMLSGNYKKGRLKKSQVPHLSKPRKIRTTACYLANSHYYDSLIEVFEESEANLSPVRCHANSEKWTIDTNWFKCQKRDLWYIFDPTVAYQMDDYSDIEGKKVSYNT